MKSALPFSNARAQSSRNESELLKLRKNPHCLNYVEAPRWGPVVASAGLLLRQGFRF
jgi:hypothetical protein